MKVVLLKNIEEEYKKIIQKQIDSGKILCPNEVIILSKMLFEDLKLKDIDIDEDEETDMLLFQYGIDSWGKGLKDHFIFDITRQFSKDDYEEMYQLSFKLVYNPEFFKDLESYNSWNTDFENIDDWIQNIRTTEGYKLAAKHLIITYEVFFTQL